MSSKVIFGALPAEDVSVVATSTTEIIRRAAEASKNPEVRITSTIRTPADQARIMFGNLEAGNRINYAAPGREVVAIYDTGKKAREAASVIKQKMTTRIEQLAREGLLVSRHCVPVDMYEKCNIVDVSKYIPNPRDFVKSLLTERRVKKIITPFSSIYNDSRVLIDANEPAIHSEIITQ